MGEFSSVWFGDEHIFYRLDEDEVTEDGVTPMAAGSPEWQQRNLSAPRMVKQARILRDTSIPSWQEWRLLLLSAAIRMEGFMANEPTVLSGAAGVMIGVAVVAALITGIIALCEA